MGFGDLLKGVGKAAASGFLDSYESTAKRRGSSDSAQAAHDLNDFVNGKVDWNGNPVRTDEEDD